MLPKLPAGFGRIGGVQDGGDGADALGSGLEDFADVAQIDSPYGKPRYRDVRRRPTHVVQRYGRDAWLGRGGIDWPHGNVGRAGGQRTQRLRGRMGAQAQHGNMCSGIRSEKL